MHKPFTGTRRTTVLWVRYPERNIRGIGYKKKWYEYGVTVIDALMARTLAQETRDHVPWVTSSSMEARVKIQKARSAYALFRCN